MSPLGSLWGHGFPPGTMGTCLPSLPRLSGEPVCLPGFLGVPKTSQSWAGSLSRQELSLKLSGREVSDPHLSDGSVCPAALGMRLSISELSFLLAREGEGTGSGREEEPFLRADRPPRLQLPLPRNRGDSSACTEPCWIFSSSCSLPS